MRGSSIDRGRGRAARGGLYHSALGSYQRSGFLYDEESRGIGTRGERTWTERNGTEADWNSTANGSPSPRKDFSSLRSGNSGESWRRSRVEDDGLFTFYFFHLFLNVSTFASMFLPHAGQLLNGTANEGWRTSSSSSSNTMYKWRKSIQYRHISNCFLSLLTNEPLYPLHSFKRPTNVSLYFHLSKFVIFLFQMHFKIKKKNENSVQKTVTVEKLLSRFWVNRKLK